MMRKRYIGLLLILGLAVFSGCLDKKDSVSVSTHPEGWSEQASADFHGSALLDKSLNEENCQSCHGADYLGGSSGLSCYSAGCHSHYPHPMGFANSNSGDFHADYIAENLRWDIGSCQSCHGTDYAGNGAPEKNCLTCHQTAGGPEACNLCHGNSENAAPPSDLYGNMANTDKAVGAHQAHLTGDTWSTFANQCMNCHTVPAAYSAPGHIDDTPHAEVNFSNLATFDGQSATAYNSDASSCANVYCHGGFEFKKDESQYPWAYTEDAISGNNPTLYWNVGNAGQTVCGSCHGLPPAGHITAQTCDGCHAGVVDANFNIINKYLHINGKVDVFGTQLDLLTKPLASTER